jgi:hypothetical protein
LDADTLISGDETEALLAFSPTSLKATVVTTGFAAR